MELDMTDEERQRTMDFIVETLGRLSVNDERRQQDNEKREQRLDRLERIAKLMVRAGLRERHNRREGDERLTNALTTLAEAQVRTEESIAHTDKRLDALIDIVRQQRNGGS